MSRDEELAETAAADTPAAATGTEPVGDTLGRYKVERVLGTGGMGVVHAAFDPELQRRVALKVLKRAADVDDSDRARLLREARAMARVKHPNVVTVYEVGSEQGRDFVAMELVEGESLAEWLRTPRPQREILAAFAAAGRGLVAAHAAGLVHRDFKPQNVLRSRDGRVLVGDFGLARGVESAVASRASLADLGAAAALTASGSLLGTPAYMAPEQWRGDEVGPPADQFAFCVALWEALAGERPFRGDTLDELRRAIEAGPDGLEASRLPHELREPLRRGLQVDPARRWPALGELLAHLERPATDRRVAIGGGLAVVGAAVAIALAAPGAPPAAVTCAPPIEELLTAAHGRAELLRELLATIPRYEAACAAPQQQRAAALECLDGVRATADAVGMAVDRYGASASSEAVSELAIDPAVCDGDAPPQLRVEASPAVADAFALALPAEVDAQAALAFAQRPGQPACARAIALELAAMNASDGGAARSAGTRALDAAEQCGDDHVRADALVAFASALASGPTATPEADAAIERARIAVERLHDPVQLAALEVVRAQAALARGDVDGVVTAMTRAIDEIAPRGLRGSELDAVQFADYARLLRSRPDDLAAIRTAAATWRPVAVALADPARLAQLDRDAAVARFYAGDDRGVHDTLATTWRPGGATARRISGVVRDAAGRPVAGALVVGGHQIYADSQSVWFPLEDAGGEQRKAVTDRDGQFTLDLTGADDLVVAQAGVLRSPPRPAADQLELVAAPTRTLDGRVALGAIPSTRVRVWVAPAGQPGIPTDEPTYQVTGPVAADGTFHLAGVSTGKVTVTAYVAGGPGGSTVKTTDVAAGTGAARVALALDGGDHSLAVIVRSTLLTKLDGAELALIPGAAPIRSVDDLLASEKASGCRMVAAQHASALPGLPADRLQPGDLAARFDHLADGTYTLCAIGLNGDLSDRAFTAQLWAHMHAIQLACKMLHSNAGVVVIEAPPQKRFD